MAETDTEAFTEDLDPREDTEDGEELDEEPLLLTEEVIRDTANLVPLLVGSKEGEKALREIASRVLEDIDSAVDSREEYCEHVAKNWELFTGHLKPKTFPFENCANLHIPVAIENALRITSHISEEIFRDWTNFVGVVPLGPDDDLVAQILSVHCNWQFREQIPGFKRQMDRALLGFFYNGDITCHSYYDSYCGLNAHDILNADEFITPYSYVTTRPDYGDLPWYARVLTKYEHELEAMAEEWHDVEAVIEKQHPSWEDEPEHRLAKAMADLKKVKAPDSDKRAPFKLYWYEGWLELPGFEEQRFCKVIIDPTTRSILLLTVLETDNWQDKLRFDRETAEALQYQQEQAAFIAETTRRQQEVDEVSSLHMTAQETNDQATQYSALQALAQMGAQPLPEPPQMPGWMKDPGQQPEPPKREPIRLFTHGVCIEPLAGNIGLGYGNMWADYTRAGNTALNQFVDSATLSNTKGMLAADTVELDGSTLVKPGKLTRVKNLPTTNIRDALMPFEFSPANGQLLEVVDRVRGYAQSASQSPEVLSGAPGKSGEPYQALAARVELATKPLSASARRFLGSLEQIVKNNAFLNSQTLREEEVFEVSKHALWAYADVASPVRVGRQLYERNYAVEFRCDLRFASMAQRIQEADEVVAMANGDPMLSMNPQFGYYARKKAFEARGRPDLVQAMGPPPPPGIMPPMGKPPGPPGATGQPGPTPPGPTMPEPARKPQAPPQ